MKNPAVDCRAGRTFEFGPAGTALLVIDMQRDFFTSDDDNDASAMQAIVPRVAALTSVMRQLGCRVIHTREGYSSDLSDVTPYRRSLGYVGQSGPLGRFLIRGEPGQDFLDALHPQPGETVIDKAGFSGFHKSDLDSQLTASGIDHLILCGVTTQCCVHSTLRDAVDLGYWCLTVADCCAASEPDLHEAALSLIAGEGHLFGWVCDLSDMEAAAKSTKAR